MARISLYAQDRLASSQVGTPGVDNSAAVVFDAIATGANRVQTQVAALEGEQVQQKAYEAVLMQQKADALAKQQTKMLNDVEDAAFGLSMTSELQATEAGLFKNLSPQEASKQYAATAVANLDKKLESVVDPTEKARLQVIGLNMIKSRMGEVESKAVTLQSKAAIGKLNSSFDMFSLSGGNYDFSEVPKVVQALQDFAFRNQDAAATAFGEEAPLKIRKAQEQMLENFFSKVARENPAALESLINNKIFDPFISDENVSKFNSRFLADAANKKRLIKEEQTYQTTVQATQEITEVLSRNIAGDATVEEATAVLDKYVAQKAPLSVIKAAELSVLAVQRKLEQEKNKESKKGTTQIDAQIKYQAKANEISKRVGVELTDINFIKKYQKGELSQSYIAGLSAQVEALASGGALSNSSYVLAKTKLSQMTALLDKKNPVAAEQARVEMRHQANLRGWAASNAKTAPSTVVTAKQRSDYQKREANRLGTKAQNIFYADVQTVLRKQKGAPLTPQQFAALEKRAKKQAWLEYNGGG